MGKTLVIILIVLVVGGAAFLMLTGKGKALMGSTKKAHAEEPVHTLALEERTVNLTGEKDGKYYLKISLALEVKGKGDAKQLKEKWSPQLMDCLIEIATRHSYEVLLTTEGKRRLKEELHTGFQEKVKGSGWEVIDVLFTDFVMGD